MTFLNALSVSSVFAVLLLLTIGLTVGILKICEIFTENIFIPVIALTLGFIPFFAILIYLGENYK
jgi:hypothetical protein